MHAVLVDSVDGALPSEMHGHDAQIEANKTRNFFHTLLLPTFVPTCKSFSSQIADRLGAGDFA